VWNQIKANVLLVPYRRLQRSELGTWGAAMVAGKAVGIFNDLGEIAHATAQADSKLFDVEPGSAEVYAPFISRYIQLQSLLRDAFNIR
jgi:sugar (pentulose or hexulose) kinase